MLPPSADLPLRPGAHLPDERLAELADSGDITRSEEMHLERCHRCRSELDAIAAIVAGARLERDRVGVPLTDWSRLAGALRAEGLVARDESGGVDAELAGRDRTTVVLPMHGRARRGDGRGSMGAARGAASWLRRGAAAVLLLAAGAAAGRVSAGAELIPGSMVASELPAARASAILADSAPVPTSDEEALAVLTRAERDYRMATAFLAGAVSAELVVDRPEVYRRRLAVMDEVASLTSAALSESPHDPVLNQYYLASLGAREATLRSLAGALPVGAQLSRF